MSRVKYSFLALFVVLMTICGISFGGNSLFLYIDLPTFIFVPVLPWLVSSFIHSFKEQKSYLQVIFGDNSSDPSVLKRSDDYFRLLKNLTISSAILACLIGFIGMLADLRDLTQVGRNFGVVVITIFYTALYLLVVIEPIRGIIRKKLH